MRILGVDPSTVATGWGVLTVENGKYVGAQSGVLRGSHNDNIDDRLLFMFDGIVAVIEKYQPDTVCIEAAFVGRNFKTAIALAKVWGAMIIATKRAGLDHHWYTVQEIRRAVTSTGRADKGQVARTVAAIMGDPDQFIQPDQADALAVAICHARRIDAVLLVGAQ